MISVIWNQHKQGEGREEDHSSPSPSWALSSHFAAIEGFLQFSPWGIRATQQEQASLKRQLGFDNHALWPFLATLQAPIAKRTIFSCSTLMSVRERRGEGEVEKEVVSIENSATMRMKRKAMFTLLFALLLQWKQPPSLHYIVDGGQVVVMHVCRSPHVELPWKAQELRGYYAYVSHC